MKKKTIFLASFVMVVMKDFPIVLHQLGQPHLPRVILRDICMHRKQTLKNSRFRTLGI